MRKGGKQMQLDRLSTFSEKETFANLALTLARADGSLDVEEVHLLRLFLAEMGFDQDNFTFHAINWETACRCFSQPASKTIVLSNLVNLCTASATGSRQQKRLLRKITLALKPKPCES